MSNVEVLSDVRPEVTMDPRPVLLAVLAHPDDETFGTGGTLALYASRGVDVYLVCATRGEVGEMDERLMRGFNSIAERREAELRCAAEKLGLTGVFFLDYRDSGMPGSPDNQHPQALFAQPEEQVVEKVVGFIRQLKPQVVITFDPIGGYFHPDHIAIQRATVQAFQSAGDPEKFPGSLPAYQPQKLYFQTIPRTFLRIMVRLMPLFRKDPRRFGINQDIDMVTIAEKNFPITATISFRSVAKQRDEAVACHVSQGGSSLSSGFIGYFRRLFSAQETYMRAYPLAKEREKEKDLFAGVVIK
jgi:LmbE family N-acetylglucosaminyl deacetylase